MQSSTYENQLAQDSDDSDILEIAVVSNASTPPPEQLSASKRRKSSPLMDPLPTYTPTPLHILEQRAASLTGDLYMPPYSADRPATSTHRTASQSSAYDQPSRPRTQATRAYQDDYVPLLEPSPSVVGRTITSSASRRPTSVARSGTTPARRPANSASALRPVSGALAQAVARRRNSQTEATKVAAEGLASEPVMWSPQLPSQIQPLKTDQSDQQISGKRKDSEPDDEYSSYKSPKPSKQRIAHKPNPTSYTNNKLGKPKVPLSVSKQKVPALLRTRYLEVIYDEFLNAGRTQDASHTAALEEEKNIAERAANRSIYINLVASLKKRIREEAGLSTAAQDENPKYVNGNKVVSHDEILTGKVVGTFSIERKRKTSDLAELTQTELYDKLKRYLVPVDQLEAYGYPQPDACDTTIRKVPLTKDGQKQHLRKELASSYTCERCAKVYRVGEDGLQLATTGKCIYHPGHLWNERINRALEKRYSCCKGDPSAGGCSSNTYHVHRGELEEYNFKGYVETKTKPELDPNNHGIFALDCEMCYTTYGLELTRVTVIDHESKVVYEKLVKPSNFILDYNTKFSGIKEGDLDDVTTRLSDVQEDLLKMFSSRSILIGHSLDSDMKALKIFHSHFIDTAQLFPHKRGLPYKRALRTLMVENLRVIIQEDVGHDSKEDAGAALRLVFWKMKTDVPEKVR